MKEVMEFLCHVWILGVCGFIWFITYDKISYMKEKTINNNKDKLINKKITKKDKIKHISFNRIYSQIGNELKIDFKYTLGDDSDYDIYNMRGNLFKMVREFKEEKILSGTYNVGDGKIDRFVTLHSMKTYCLIEKEGYIYKYRALSYYELSYISRKKITKKIGE